MAHTPGPKEIRARQMREERADKWGGTDKMLRKKVEGKLLVKAMAEATERTSKPKAKKKPKEMKQK